eukprot:431920-Ditylum_brightwellii.AAC.1
MHDPPLEQMEDDDEDNDSTCVPDEEDSEKDTDDTSILSIDSLQDAPICHNVSNSEPLTNTTDTTADTTHVGNDDNDFTAGVNIQEEEDESSLSSEEESEEEPSLMAGVQQGDHSHDQIEEEEEVILEDETLQAKINEREVQ